MEDRRVTVVADDEVCLVVMAQTGREWGIGLTLNEAARLAKDLMEAVDYIHAGAPLIG